MESLIITPTTKEEAAFLKKLARNMGFDVRVLSKEEKEDFALGKLILEARNTELVSRDKIMKTLRPALS